MHGIRQRGCTQLTTAVHACSALHPACASSRHLPIAPHRTRRHCTAHAQRASVRLLLRGPPPHAPCLCGACLEFGLHEASHDVQPRPRGCHRHERGPHLRRPQQRHQAPHRQRGADVLRVRDAQVERKAVVLQRYREERSGVGVERTSVSCVHWLALGALRRRRAAGVRGVRRLTRAGPTWAQEAHGASAATGGCLGRGRKHARRERAHPVDLVPKLEAIVHLCRAPCVRS
jgi:hypothetical protein